MVRFYDKTIFQSTESSKFNNELILCHNSNLQNLFAESQMLNEDLRESGNVFSPSLLLLLDVKRRGNI